jgi:hypothetical protein
MPAGGGDQPHEKNILITPTFQDGSPPVIRIQSTTREKETGELRDSGPTPTLLPHISSSPSPQITPAPSPHTTPPPSPHHSPIPSANTLIFKPSSSPIQVVEIGDGDTSSSESTESDKGVEKSQEEEKAPGSSRILFKDPKNPFSTRTMMKTPVKKKMFSIESLGAASKVIGIESWLEDTFKRKIKR